MTHLRQMMLDELQRRNYSQNTVYTYLHAVDDFARYFHRSPDRLGPDHIRQYQAYLFRERKLQAGTIACCTAALRFLYVKTLRRPYLLPGLGRITAYTEKAQISVASQLATRQARAHSRTLGCLARPTDLENNIGAAAAAPGRVRRRSGSYPQPRTG